MANTVKVKRSNTALANPSLVFGEFGFNSADSKLFIGNAANANFQIGSVTSVSVVTANGVSASVATSTSTPAITVSLGAITPSSVTVSGVITCSAGTAALPSITASGDTNTGIFFPAADNFAITTNGAAKIQVDSAGNVGLAIREDGGIAPSTAYLTTQAQAGLTILHAAKGGIQASGYQPKRHLMAYGAYLASANGIMRIKIPVNSSNAVRVTIKNTGYSSASFSRSWEITLSDYYAANYIFTKDTFSITGSPNFGRVRLMTDGTNRYLILGYFVAGVGTVTNTAASATVTGTATKFLTIFRVGDAILIAGNWYYVTGVSSNTSLTISGTITLANTAVTYSRGESFIAPQMTIDVDVIGSTLTPIQINTAFAIDIVDTEAGLSLVSAANDFWMTNTNSQHSFVGVGTQRPTSLLHVKAEKQGQGTVSNGAAGTTVTGVNTAFLDFFKVGDSITIPSDGVSGTSQTVVISAIASNTSMTVAAITSANSAVTYSAVGGDALLVSGNGNVSTGLGQLSVTGGRIVFPAAANVSTNANTLDDYEEGTWTPVTTASVPGATPPTFSAVTGTYTKTGRVVTVLWTITTNVLGTGSGVLLCAGLPFAADVVSSGSGVQTTTTRASQTVHVAASASSATITKYDGTYPLFAASVHIFSMTYTTTS